MQGQSRSSAGSGKQGGVQFIADAHRALIKSTGITNELRQPEAPARTAPGQPLAGLGNDAMMQHIRNAAHAAAAAADPRLAFAALAAPEAQGLASPPAVPGEHGSMSDPTHAEAAGVAAPSTPTFITAPAAVAGSFAVGLPGRQAGPAAGMATTGAAGDAGAPPAVQDSDGHTVGAASAAAVRQSTDMSAARSAQVDASSQAAVPASRGDGDAPCPTGGTDESGASRESGSTRPPTSMSAGVTARLETSLLIDGGSTAAPLPPAGPPRSMPVGDDGARVATSLPSATPLHPVLPNTAPNRPGAVQSGVTSTGAAAQRVSQHLSQHVLDEAHVATTMGMLSGQDSAAGARDVAGGLDMAMHAATERQEPTALAHGDAGSGDGGAYDERTGMGQQDRTQEDKAAGAMSAQRPESHAAGAMHAAASGPDESAQGSHAPGGTAERHSAQEKVSSATPGSGDGGRGDDTAKGTDVGNKGSGGASTVGGCQTGDGRHHITQARSESSRPAQGSAAQPPKQSSSDAVEGVEAGQVAQGGEGATTAQAKAGTLAVDPRVEQTTGTGAAGAADSAAPALEARDGAMS